MYTRKIIRVVCGILLSFIIAPLFSRPMVHSFTVDSGSIVQAEHKSFPFSFSRIRYYVEEDCVETVWLHTQSDQIIYWRKDADGNGMERFVYPNIDMSYFLPLTE